MILKILCAVFRGLLSLRYRIRVTGLDDVAHRGKNRILFLPNHPALIDPLILFTRIYPPFSARFLADKDQVDKPVVRFFARLAGVRAMRDPLKYGDACRNEVELAISECVKDLQQGDNVLLYPAGRIYRQSLEDLGGNSAVETILREVPNIRVVLIRTRGLWGSSFSRASGKTPDFNKVVVGGFRFLLANILFIGPRREVSIELVEPNDIQSQKNRLQLNRYLEAFYNTDARPNTYVPYFWWQGRVPRILPELSRPASDVSADMLPQASRDMIFEHLRELTGKKDLREEQTLAGDLALDSLARVELASWLEKEFGFSVNSEDALQTVADVLRAAAGLMASAPTAELKPIPKSWFTKVTQSPSSRVPEGKNILEVFLAQASLSPNRTILADQTAGALSYRDIVTRMLLLAPRIAALPGPYIAIMLPASAGAAVIYLAALAAGKIPVMLNWTVGSRNMAHALQNLDVRHVLTVKPLIQKLESQGVALDEIKDRFLFLEDVRSQIGLGSKLRAAMLGRMSWLSLRRARVADVAVVLFTSGSENLPKAVPLTHQNVLTNMRDMMSVFRFNPDDCILGMLPPFHSFGVNVTMALPLCAGLRVVYYPNPTEGSMLARIIEAYQVTLLVGTPTFLQGILRVAKPSQLTTLRAVISGAEKCPPTVYDMVHRDYPQLLMMEGYGITECSPVVSVNDERDPRPYTIGKVMPSLKHVLVDPDTGKRVGQRRQGMLLLRGPSIFGGYLNYDGPSPFTSFEGEEWYRTGDLVVEDAAGVLTFSGRLKRFVKIGGEMISLPAIEELLAVQFRKDGDEGPVLAVESTPVETNPELILFTTLAIERDEANKVIRDGGLSPLHNIRIVRRVESIPTLGTGKTDYRALRELVKTAVSNK